MFIWISFSKKKRKKEKKGKKCCNLKSCKSQILPRLKGATCMTLGASDNSGRSWNCLSWQFGGLAKFTTWLPPQKSLKRSRANGSKLTVQTKSRPPCRWQVGALSIGSLPRPRDKVRSVVSALSKCAANFGLALAMMRRSYAETRDQLPPPPREQSTTACSRDQRRRRDLLLLFALDIFAHSLRCQPLCGMRVTFAQQLPQTSTVTFCHLFFRPSHLLTFLQFWCPWKIK